jgi:hypothetical protein
VLAINGVQFHRETDRIGGRIAATVACHAVHGLCRLLEEDGRRLCNVFISTAG